MRTWHDKNMQSKSSGLYRKKDKVLHEEPRPIKADMANYYETEFLAFRGFVVSELTDSKTLINEMFLKFEN